MGIGGQAKQGGEEDFPRLEETSEIAPKCKIWVYLDPDSN